MNYKIEQFKKYKDHRGELIVFLTDSQLLKSQKKFGQIYFVTFKKKGAVRGNHFHKKWYEWFGIIAGKVQVVLEDVRTKERIELKLSARVDKYTRLEVGPYIAHSFKSLTKYASLLNYADGEWSANDDFDYDLM